MRCTGLAPTIGRYHVSGYADTAPSTWSGIAIVTEGLRRGTVPAAKFLHGFLHHIRGACMVQPEKILDALHIALVYCGALLK